MPNPNYVGEIIKDLRVRKKMTRFDLVYNLKNIHGISVTTETIRNWENLNSSPNPETLNVIASILDTPIEKFFREVEQ